MAATTTHPASSSVEVAGRLGLAARGVVYVFVALLAGLVAAGVGEAQADTTGALSAIRDRSWGPALLWVLAACLLGYAVWRASEAATGRTSDDPDAGAGARALSALKAAVYLGAALAAVQLAAGGGTRSNAEQQQHWTAKVLEWPGGTAIVVAVGVALVVAGLAQLKEGVTGSFMERLDVGGEARRVVRAVGGAGYAGRGVAFALVGLFVVRAALDHDPSKSRGLDGALAELAQEGYGPPLLVLLALGLLAFGVASFAEARWRRIRT